MVPLDRTTPPIELDTPAGVEIAPEGVIVVFPFVILLWDKAHPPTSLDDMGPVIMA
jgi:hypothetical protein